MPFVSRKQASWMFQNKPKMAKEWANKTPSIKELPERASKIKSRLAKRSK